LQKIAKKQYRKASQIKNKSFHKRKGLSKQKRSYVRDNPYKPARSQSQNQKKFKGEMRGVRKSGYIWKKRALLRRKYGEPGNRTGGAGLSPSSHSSLPHRPK
jgi:hypothetical protein